MLLYIIQEIIVQYYNSPNISYNELNNTLKNILYTAEKLNLTPNVHYILLFIQQRYNIINDYYLIDLIKI
jgi:hypothetical protein